MILRMTIMIMMMFALSACATNEVTPTPQADGQTGYKSFLDRSQSPAFHQALMAFTAEDYTNAIAMFDLLARAGDAKAHMMLGMMYYQGQGVDQDFDKARDNFLVSANAGIAEAQGMIGSMYAEAKGFRQNYVKAARWYERAAEQGFAPRKAYWGRCMAQGTVSALIMARHFIGFAKRPIKATVMPNSILVYFIIMAKGYP